MEPTKIKFRILRFKPGRIDPPRHQEFVLAVGPHTTVLDVLEQLRLEQDQTLMYRHSCHHSSCGTCACMINGVPRPACVTGVLDLGTATVTLEPLIGFRTIGDLVVDMRDFYADLSEEWSGLRAAEDRYGKRAPQTHQGPVRFENCIECGCCVAACPAVGDGDGFMGPAALAAIHNEMLKSPGKKTALLALADGERGQRLCRRALNCSRVCPTAVYPARHIADLRRMVSVAEGGEQ
jgi:succinate dehydrogenase / fumarate reductase iron-sulfur subunit